MLRSIWHHRAALYAIGEIYLALDRPDENFVGDFQTEGFDARLWELYLFAAFREQGIDARQDFPSPDFHLVRGGRTVFVEGVTANPLQRMQPLSVPYAPAPKDIDERTLGAPAARFAKSLRSKMAKRYWRCPTSAGTHSSLRLPTFTKAGP